ncbi:hypothetical protein KC345_g4697 [Hortaea werneckii]|nr:hypothetical protein KC345_g4697 [Hortaea werneckii]
MKYSTAFLGVLSLGHQAAVVVDKWTPEGSDRSKIPSHEGVLFQNVSAAVPPTRDLVVYAAERHNMTELEVQPVEHLAIAAAIGWVVANPVSFTVGAAGAAGAIRGCVGAFRDTTFDSAFFCGLGLAATIGGFGFAKSADKAIRCIAGKYYGRNRWLSSGLEEIDLDVFSKRHAWKRELDSGLQSRSLSEDEHHNQMVHNYITHLMIRDAGYSDVEFLGYEDDEHQLSKRSTEVHPLVPRFRFTHHAYGPLIMATKDTNPTHHITLHPEESNPKFAKRDAQFREERLSDHLMEGRFDKQASQSDSATLSATAQGSFGMVESGIKCFVNEQGMTQWPSKGTNDMQMYDNANRVTFGYGSIGIFDDHNTDGQFHDLQPQPPLTGGMSC